MFRISPTLKDKKNTAGTGSGTGPEITNPVMRWGIENNFRFPEPKLCHDEHGNGHPKGEDNCIRLKPIYEVPKIGSSLYHLLSQSNPWLDCEMTREKRAHLKPNAGEMYCAIYTVNTNADTNLFRYDTFVDIINLYLWPLLHSRADHVIACRTFSEWAQLFQRTIILAFPDYTDWVSVATSGSICISTSSSQIVPASYQYRMAQLLKYITPARVLHLLTVQANIWPYGLSKISQVSRSANQYGLCSIKSKVKEYTDKTKIEWLVSAEFLRKMKRVHIYFTSSSLSGTFGVPSVSSNSMCIYDTDDLDL
jgi:hypothetical protein